MKKYSEIFKKITVKLLLNIIQSSKKNHQKNRYVYPALKCNELSLFSYIIFIDCLTTFL